MINKIKSLLIFFVTMITSQVIAQNNYNVFLDCATNDDSFDCFEIREALKIKLVNSDKIVSDLDDSNISLKIRTRVVNEAAVRLILVEQYFQIKGDTTPILIEIKKYRESDFNISTITDLANHIAVHLAKLRGVVSVKSEDEGVVVVFAKGNTTSTSPGGEEKDWYVEPSGYFSGNNSVGESSTMQVGASGTLVKANAKNKFILGAFGSFYNQRIQFENGEVENYQEVGVGVSTFYIRTLKNNRWSVAIFTNIYSNPVRDNVDYKQQVRLGIEYNLVPFITKSEDRVFVVRYSIGPDYYNFSKANLNDQMSVWLLKHGISLASTIILNKFNHDNLPLSVRFELRGDSEVNSFRYAALNASIEVNYNITDRISLTPSYSLTFADAYVNQPINDVAGVIGDVKNAGQFASEKHRFYIKLNFAFGSPGLKNKDTRWSSM